MVHPGHSPEPAQLARLGDVRGRAGSDDSAVPDDGRRAARPAEVAPTGGGGQALQVERERITAMSVATAVRPYTLATYGGKTVVHYGGPLTVKADRASTGGSLSLIEYVAPVGVGTPLHIHTHEDEAFYILEGKLTVTALGTDRVVGPGGFLFLPREEPHAWRVEGPEPVRMLILLTPPGFEQSLIDFAALEAQVERLEDIDPRHLAAMSVQTGVRVVGASA